MCQSPQSPNRQGCSLRAAQQAAGCGGDAHRALISMQLCVPHRRPEQPPGAVSGCVLPGCPLVCQVQAVVPLMKLQQLVDEDVQVRHM